MAKQKESVVVQDKEQRKKPPPTSCFTLGDLALLEIWLLVMLVVYSISTRITRNFFDWAVFGGAVLCIANDRKRVAPVALIAILFSPLVCSCGRPY